MSDSIEQKFSKTGLKLTDQRRTIAKILLDSKQDYGESDHPDVDELYKRVLEIDENHILTNFNIGTYYFTLRKY
jgi:Fur family ferric uptake transcriptional regulator